MYDAQGEKEIKHRGEEKSQTTVDVNSGMKKRTTPSRDESDNTKFGGLTLFRSLLFRIKLSHQNTTLLLGKKLLGNRL